MDHALAQQVANTLNAHAETAGPDGVEVMVNLTSGKAHKASAIDPEQLATSGWIVWYVEPGRTTSWRQIHQAAEEWSEEVEHEAAKRFVTLRQAEARLAAGVPNAELDVQDAWSSLMSWITEHGLLESRWDPRMDHGKIGPATQLARIRDRLAASA